MSLEPEAQHGCDLEKEIPPSCTKRTLTDSCSKPCVCVTHTTPSGFGFRLVNTSAFGFQKMLDDRDRDNKSVLTSRLPHIHTSISCRCCHRPVAFQVCAAVIYSWEEEQLATSSCAPSEHGNAERRLQQHHNHGGSRGQDLSSVLAVFDTLTDACFVTFNDGDTETLTAALGAVWTADGALRRVSMQKTPPWEDRDDGNSSPDSESHVSSSAPTTTRGFVPAEDGGASGNSSAVFSEFGQQNPIGRLSSGGGGGGYGDGDTSGQENAHDAIIGNWVEDSRVVGVVRSLTQRCRGLPARVEETGKTGNGDGDSGDQLASSTEGVGASLPSEDIRDGAAWPQVGAMSLLELAEAVLDAVGPEATGDILAVCPQLLENMPPKVCTM